MGELHPFRMAKGVRVSEARLAGYARGGGRTGQNLSRAQSALPFPASAKLPINQSTPSLIKESSP